MVMMVGELYILIEIIIFGNYFLGAILFQSAHTAPSGTAIALLYNSVRAGSVGHLKQHLMAGVGALKHRHARMRGEHHDAAA